MSTSHEHVQLTVNEEKEIHIPSGTNESNSICRKFAEKVVWLFVIALSICFVVWLATKEKKTKNNVEFLEESHNCTYYSESYPSEGGADCPHPCLNGTRSRNSAYFKFPPILYQNMLKAQSIMKKYGEPTYLVPEGVEHITFSYHCCYTDEQFDVIKEVLQNHTFPPIKVETAEVVCRIDGPLRSHVSLIIQTTEECNRELMNSIESIEAEIKEQGLPVHIPRAEQQTYHITIGVVPGELGPDENKIDYTPYPVQLALAEINRVIPPGTWLGDEEAILGRPCESRNETLC